MGGVAAIVCVVGIVGASFASRRPLHVVLWLGVFVAGMAIATVAAT